MIFFSNDKLRINCKSTLVKNPRADILLIHGLGEHSGRYTEFVKQFSSNSYNVHRMDLRGHGCSEGLRGYVDDFSKFHQDIDAWYSFLLSKNHLDPNRPVFVFAHSLGGLIALDYFLSLPTYPENIVGLALSSPALGVLSVAALLGSLVNIDLPQSIEQIHFPNGINPSYLSHDEDIVQEYKEDPLVHNKITIGLFRNILRAIERVRRSKSSLSIPVLFFVAENDRIIDSAAILKFAKKLKAEDKNIQYMKGFYHEIFMEKKRGRAYELLKRWLEKCLKNSSELSEKRAIRRGILPLLPEKKALSI